MVRRVQAAHPIAILTPSSCRLQVTVGREGQTRVGTVMDFDANRPRYKWYVRYIGYAEPAYGGAGEWGCLDDDKATWLTHGYKRPVLSCQGGVGGTIAVGGAGGVPGLATGLGGGAGGAPGFKPRKGPFGRTGMGLLYLLAGCEPGPDGKYKPPAVGQSMRGTSAR